jgi:hypothetical protein
MTTRFNKSSISAKFKKAEEKIEGEFKKRLYPIVDYLVSRTPVDTGAYAESWSVVPASSGGGRSKTAKGRPRNQDMGSYRALAESNMSNDIAAIELEDNKSVSFRNRAPHRDDVEKRHQIFGSAKDAFKR